MTQVQEIKYDIILYSCWLFYFFNNYKHLHYNAILKQEHAFLGGSCGYKGNQKKIINQIYKK